MEPGLKATLLVAAMAAAVSLFPRIRHLITRLRYVRVAPWTGQAVSRTGSPTAEYQIEILNDDRTHMEFVVRVLQCCFGMNRKEAIRSMLQVHNSGSAVVGYAPRNVAEALIAHVSVQAQQRAFPLQLRISDAQQGAPGDVPRPAGSGRA